MYSACRIVENFHWCIFPYKFEFSVRAKFRSSNFWIFQVLQAMPPWTQAISNFSTHVACFFQLIRGYHAYRDIWSTVIGECLPCEKESGNLILTGKKFIGSNFRTLCKCLKCMQKFAPFENFLLYGILQPYSKVHMLETVVDTTCR